MTREEALQKALAAAGRCDVARTRLAAQLAGEKRPHQDHLDVMYRTMSAHAAEATAWATIALALGPDPVRYHGTDQV